MARVRAVVLGTSGFVLGVLTAVSAIGVLYFLRGPTASWSGPRVVDALPLNELYGHDSVSVVMFLLVWGGAAAMLGVLARSLGLSRLTAALVLGTLVGAVVYGVTGLSLYVVRGLARREILHIPAGVRAVYVPPALTALAGALMGRPGRARTIRPGFLAMLVGVAGLLDIASAVTPEIRERLAVIDRFAPTAIPPVASALVVPVGLVLLLAARGLARCKRRAWQLVVVLLVGSTVLHLLKGLDFEEAIVTGVLALALFARRHEFIVRGDPSSSPRLLSWVGGLMTAIYAYGAIALWVNQKSADQPYTLGFAAKETTRALVGLSFGGSATVGGRFGSWFPLSVVLLEAVAAGWLVLSWLAPWRYRLRQEARASERAQSLVREWGWDTLAPFVLRPDKSYFFGHQEQAMVAYTALCGVALMSGDPIGPIEAVGPVLEDFLQFVHDRDWRLAVLGASRRSLGLYEAHGLHWMYHGDEAVIRISGFSLQGRAIRKVRQSVHRLERAGYRSDVLSPREVDPALRSELEAIVEEWRGGQPQKGFVMTLDSPFRLEGEDAVFVIGRDAQDRPQGFLHFAVCRAGAALSLSAMPRRCGSPNGFNEWLICESVSWARCHGYSRLSLNFAPFAAILDPTASLTRLQRLERDALLAMKARLRFQLDNLLMFSGQFQPEWEQRFVVYERWGDLPRIGISALTAEGYLPFRAPRAELSK